MGGPTAHGIESTVVDLSELDRGGPPLLLRQGAIAREALSAHLPGLVDGAAIAPERSPGLRHRHYAPRARLEIVDNGALAERARLANPMLLALDERVRQQRALGEVARLEGRPEFSVGLDYIVTNEAINVVVPWRRCMSTTVAVSATPPAKLAPPPP